MMRKQREKIRQQRGEEFALSHALKKAKHTNGQYPVPTELTGADLAFGCIDHLPSKEQIPEEFWKDSHPASHAAQMLFFKGGKLEAHGFVPKDGIIVGQATRAIGAILASFEPKHEHKIAGCGFLIDQWFKKAA